MTGTTSFSVKLGLAAISSRAGWPTVPLLELKASGQTQTDCYDMLEPLIDAGGIGGSAY